jgi:predicted RNA-binding protein
MGAETEFVRVAAFDTITMENGEWDGPKRDEDVMTYTAKTNGVSLTVLLGGKKVFDGDYNKGAQIRIVEDVVHLPEGATLES